MSEQLRDLVVSLSLNSDNFTRNLTSINRQIQEAESEFRQAASGVNGFERSGSGTESKLSMLQQKLQLQRYSIWKLPIFRRIRSPLRWRLSQ